MSPRYGNLATGLVAFDDGTYGCYPYAPLGRGYRVDPTSLQKFNRARELVVWLWPLACALISVGWAWLGGPMLLAVFGWHHFLVNKHLAARHVLPALSVKRWASLQANKGAGGAIAMAVLLPGFAAALLIAPPGPFKAAVVVAIILLLPLPYLLMVLSAAWKRTATS